VFVENNFALWQIEIERLAPRPCGSQHLIGRPQRPQHVLHKRLAPLRRLPVEGSLSLLVAELGGRPHYSMNEGMRAFIASAVEDHANGKAGAILALSERAEVV